MCILLDRQAVESEEKLDGVKQYAMWRQLPRHLAVRLKRHYKYQYERDGVQLFNEMDLLNGCPPALRSDLIASVLAETLGKVRALREGRRTRRACTAYVSRRGRGGAIASRRQASANERCGLDGGLPHPVTTWPR